MKPVTLAVDEQEYVELVGDLLMDALVEGAYDDPVVEGNGCFLRFWWGCNDDEEIEWPVVQLT